MAKTSRIGLKVTEPIYEVLKEQAERRGVAISALCAWLCGEFVVNLQNQEKAQQIAAEKAAEAVRGEFQKLTPELLKTLETLGNQADIEDYLGD
jgi:hypothetical protein